MKKLLGLMTLAVIGICAMPAIAAAPPGDKVEGHGKNNPSVATNRAEFTFDKVKSGPNGENPSGKVRFKTLANDAQEEGNVVCLAVQGNLATIGVVYTKLSKQQSGNPNDGVIVHVAANGKPFDPPGPTPKQYPDQITSMGVPNAADVNCADVSPIVDHTLTYGDIKVTDNGVRHD